METRRCKPSKTFRPRLSGRPRFWRSHPEILCRHCYRLAYASQSEELLDRTRRRANRIRRRLGGEPGWLSRFPDKPKGMWNRTYERLRAAVIDSDMRPEEIFEMQAGRMLARLEGKFGKGSFW